MTEQQIRDLRQALVNADAVARQRGDEHGLCDCVDNAGTPYPSAWLDGMINRALYDGVVPEVRPDAMRNPRISP